MRLDPDPFVVLPAALVEEIIKKTEDVGSRLLEKFENARVLRASRREQLQQKGLILHEASLSSPVVPTTCAADGSYAIERLLTVDLVVAAAVATEGLTPPSERRYWEQPHHATFVRSEPHHAETGIVLRALMLGEELLLATKAPHDVVMLDGTITLPIIYFNQALTQLENVRGLECAKVFAARLPDYLEAYLTVLRASRTDKQFIALPKYSTRREICTLLGCSQEDDDKGLLTLLLESGELTKPIPLEQPKGPWHLNVGKLAEFGGVQTEMLQHCHAVADSILQALRDVHVFYFKPRMWLPALRVEAGHALIGNQHRLSVVVSALKHQCAAPSMLEPYPVYMADRIVKSLSKSLSSFRQVATRQVAEKYNGKVDDVFLAMHGCRSEGGQ